jgi:hypothetical protein
MGEYVRVLFRSGAKTACIAVENAKVLIPSNLDRGFGSCFLIGDLFLQSILISFAVDASSW